MIKFIAGSLGIAAGIGYAVNLFFSEYTWCDGLILVAGFMSEKIIKWVLDNEDEIVNKAGSKLKRKDEK